MSKFSDAIKIPQDKCFETFKNNIKYDKYIEGIHGLGSVINDEQFVINTKNNSIEDMDGKFLEKISREQTLAALYAYMILDRDYCELVKDGENCPWYC